jgi:hypothetical protein
MQSMAMSSLTPDKQALRNERRLKKALRHRNASPYDRSIKESLDADLPRRLAVFASGEAERWTAVIRLALAALQRGKLRGTATRPCDYAPWRKALAVVGADSLDLMGFADTASRPPWPKDRQSLIEFALTFLEADVMLFRSGYTKRYLLDRLRHSDLTPDQVGRVVEVLKQMVMTGMGCEEFRAARRLAATLRPEDLTAWLEPLAAGAKLMAVRHLSFSEWMEVRKRFNDKQQAQLNWQFPFARPKCAIRADLGGDPVAMSAEDWADPDNQRAVNAWLMLSAIRRGSPAGHADP